MNVSVKIVLSIILSQLFHSLLFFGRPVASISIDNEIVGPINITCSKSGISVNFKTKNTFEGRVYLRGPMVDPDCPTDVDQMNETDVVVLPSTDCNLQKQQLSLMQEDSPGDGTQINMVTVSFHPLGIITEADKTFKVECSNKNVDLMLTQSFEVSALPAEAGGILRPSQTSCTYTIRAQSLQGPIVKFANVGDTVFHIWECHNDEHTMFIHNCFAWSGNQSEIALIDETGCSLDKYLLSNLTYSKNMSRAYASADVFKFMDLAHLSFKCNVELCHKTNVSCTNHSLPVCANVEQSEVSYKERKRREAPNGPSLPSPIIVNSQEMFVNNLNENVDDFMTKSNQQSSSFMFPDHFAPVEGELFDVQASWCAQSNLAVIAGLVGFSSVASFLFGLLLSNYIPIRRVSTNANKCQA